MISVLDMIVFEKSLLRITMAGFDLPLLDRSMMSLSLKTVVSLLLLDAMADETFLENESFRLQARRDLTLLFEFFV